jgi:hypothetical protein
MNFLHRGGDQPASHRRPARVAVQSLEERSNQMRKMLSFTLGVLVGTVVATAWAHFPNYPTMDSPRAAASMNPHEMMSNARPLPVQQYDAF